jgi:hypothetical protein
VLQRGLTVTVNVPLHWNPVDYGMCVWCMREREKDYESSGRKA